MRRSRSIWLILFAAGILSASAAPIDFAIDPAHTTVRFEIRHLLGRVAGNFHDVRGTLRIDPDHPENSSVVATCPSGTVETDNGIRDRHLRTELFEVEKFPVVTFRSSKINRTGPRQADVTGDLTLHGVTHPILLHVTLVERTKTDSGRELSRWRATGGNFSRRQFGLVWPRAVETVSMIGDEVSLTITCEARAID